jgi:hypothetical protein
LRGQERRQLARIGCCSAFVIAPDRRLRLDGRWSGDQIMKSMSPPWVWIALALALLVIGYVVTPPAVIQQATALWSWG